LVIVLPAIVAHRLGRAYGPDSSRAALDRSLEQHVDGLETDCCLTADGELVLLHDPLLELGTDQRGREEEVLNADALQPSCLRPAGERVDAVVGDDDQARPEAHLGGELARAREEAKDPETNAKAA
jgi:glycerophosphoryl diester phosphodiesterase